MLSGCLGNLPQTIDISSKPIEKPQLELQPVDEIRLRNVEWVIINAENIEEKIAEFTANGQPLAIFALSDEGYENLGLNFSDIRALVQQQQAIIVAYENYYKQAEAVLETVD